MNTKIKQISQEGTFIPFTAAKGMGPAVADLLEGAASLVEKTEPLTLQWFALHEADEHFVIADFFNDNKGREAHFAGQVAAALNQAAPQAVEGGWEDGVVANVENSTVLSYAVNAGKEARAHLAVRIDIQANPGMEEALAELLTGAAAVIETTEPDTLLWYAIRISHTRFAIFDVFANEEGKAAHFAGQVAAALKSGAEKLVLGGWDKGVVANIRNYTVLSATY